MKRYETHNKKDGKEKTCKFCGGHVWWDIIERRWFNPGGEVLHVETCELRKAHFKSEASQRADDARQKRG